MRKALFIALGLVLLLVATGVGVRISKHGAYTSARHQPSAQEAAHAMFVGFTHAAEQINAGGPKMVDADTRLDRASAGPGAQLTYHYTFTTFNASDIDREYLLRTFRPRIVQSVCHDASMLASMTFGATYWYSYTSSDGLPVLDFKVTQFDCGLFA